MMLGIGRCVASLLLGWAGAQAASFEFTDVIVPGFAFVNPYDIANSGIVVGIVNESGSPFPGTGFLWSANSEPQTFAVPGVNPTFGTEAYSVNAAGVVVGSVFPGCCSTTRQGFTRQTSGNSALPEFTLVRGINDLGVIGGNLTTGLIGLRQPDGSVQPVDLGLPSPILEDINNNGAFVGYFFPPNGKTLSFLHQPTGITLLEYPDAPMTVANGLNDLGQVVGFYRGNDFLNHGFIWDAVTGFQTVDHPAGAAGTVLYGINNSGTITGTYSFVGPARGFIGTPVPEPGTWSITGLALVGVALSRRARP